MWLMGMSNHGISGLVTLWATLQSRHECTLSKVGIHPDMTLYVARK